jgi:predicted XRE-type DNA-binding protein
MAKTFDSIVARTMSKTSRARAKVRARQLMAEMLLSELRKASGYSQKELAGKLRIQQPSLSKLEGARDMQVTTLKKLVAAMGGEVEIVAKFPHQKVRLVQFDGAFVPAERVDGR